MERPTESRPVTHPLAIAALALLGPALGVATQGWAQALLLLGLSVLLIFAPPRQAPGVPWRVLFLALCIIGLTAFFPSKWFAMPEWRRVLAADFRVEMPETMSPQPWVSLHAFWLLAAGMTFALYLVAQEWSPLTRRRALRCYAGGIVVLALIAMIFLAVKWRPPFWPDVQNLASGFGLFPNRNQTANVFALAGIIATALAFDAFQRRRMTGWFWVAAVLILGAGLIQAYSRAGILLFFGGIGVWVLLSSAFSKSHKGAALSVAGIALALAAFSVFGGDTLERFFRRGGGEIDSFRFKIHTDAVKLAASAPWFGQGLGNFAPVFAMAREASVEQNRAIHPESDWLWVAVEMGWPAVALLALAVVLWLKQCFPFSNGSDRSLRAAALVCGIAFAAHAFGDVSGHRPGSAWPALFLASLAMNPARSMPGGRWVAAGFRMLGVIVGLVSLWWLVSVRSEWIARNAPTMQSLSSLTERVRHDNARGEFSNAVASANEALAIAPLSADLYFQRGVARVGESFSYHGAAWDFGTARFLEPRWVQLCISEGQVWLEADQPVLAMDAWLEALRRARAEAPMYYGQMLSRARDKIAVRSQLARLARANPDYFVVFLNHADRLECELLIGQLLDAEPKLESFSSDQRKALFAVWYQRGDRALLLTRLAEDPVWQKEGWLWLAMSFAGKGEHEHAWRLARESITAPALPPFPVTKPVKDLERAFQNRGEDLQAGIQLFAAQRAAGKITDAIATLQKLQTAKVWPSYLAFVEAELWAENREWEKAWNALRRFIDRDRR